MCSALIRLLTTCEQNQWQRKKQTKEEKKAARKAKLDPANQKTAKDVMDENERKRKRELGMDSEEEVEVSLQQNDTEDGERVAKKPKTNGKAAAPEDEAARNKAKAEKRKEKRERKKEKIEKKKEKADVKKAKKQDQDLGDLQAENIGKANDDDDSEDEAVENGDEDVDAMDISGLAEAEDDLIGEDHSSVPASPDADSPVFDISADQSAASSSSSIVPPATAPDSHKNDAQDATSTVEVGKPKKEKAFNMPKIDSEELQARLRARIEELRARRKADGPEGNAPRSRQELLDARRKKSDARKQHKKELRAKAKQEEDRINNERLRGSGSPLSADIFSPRSPIERENFSFGRVAFEDGQQIDASLGSISDVKKRKGPQDPKTALEAAQKKAARISGYDESKRSDIEQKDLWLNAKKRAHGERVRDDQSLLKKALKRKEKTKSKSEKEWNERIEGVRHGKEMKQKKREENLSKRKEDKGSKKGKGKPKSKGKPKGRPGFEGSRR